MPFSIVIHCVPAVNLVNMIQSDWLIGRKRSLLVLSAKSIKGFTSQLTGPDFAVPKAVKDVSLGHIHKRKLEKTDIPTEKSSYLLLLQAGAVTQFHQDFADTSVMHIPVKN